MDMTRLMEICGHAIYGGLGLLALWGAFCVILLLQRISTLSFRSAEAGNDFLGEVSGLARAGEIKRAAKMCDAPERRSRALVQMAALALAHRKDGPVKLRQLLAAKFVGSILSGLQHSLSWIHTVARSAPMMGLLGTVVGMIGAFSKIAGVEKTDPSVLAQDISLALFTTGLGLVIAIPLILSASFATVRIRRLESAVEDGVAQLLNELEEGPPDDEARGATRARRRT